MDDRRKHTAADLVNTLSEQDLSNALWELSDEPDHAVIARRIVAQRTKAPLTTIEQLVNLVFSVKDLTAAKWKQHLQFRPGLLHPAARTFQALRILVNDEMASLRELLRLAPHCLRTGGRIGIISFHSGEDRLVKKSFAEGLVNGLYQTVCPDVITPQKEEIASNPRSSSAKFRWAVKA
jgi:16S rRNA (cytosine1402-N4)-methyltransferase